MFDDSPRHRDTLYIAARLPASAPAVYGAHLDADALTAWWGDAHSETTVVELDPTVGGVFEYAVDQAHGRPIRGRQEFDTLDLNVRIVYRSSLISKAGVPIRPPGVPTWPLVLRGIVDLVPDGDDVTVLSLLVSPFEATDHERTAFRDARNLVEASYRSAYKRLHRWLSSASADV